MPTQLEQDPRILALQPLEEFMDWLTETAAQFYKVFKQETLMLEETIRLIAETPLPMWDHFEMRWMFVEGYVNDSALAHIEDVVGFSTTMMRYVDIWMKNLRPSPHGEQSVPSFPVRRPTIESTVLVLLDSWRKHEEKTGILSRLFAEVQESAGNHEHQEIGTRFATLASDYSARLASRAPQPSSQLAHTCC